MRLAFPNGEHDDVSVGKGSLTIGSSPGDNVVLDGDGIEAGHAVIIVDRRGITLNVDAESGQVTVNGRPVVARAILRLGDRLEVGPVSMVLRGDEARLRAPPERASDGEGGRGAAPKFHLRGINGHHQGRIIALTGNVTLGRSENCDLVIPDVELASELARIEVDGAGVYLRSLTGEPLEINGNHAAEAVLDPGDQITIGQHRFLVETPGFVPGKAYVGVETKGQASNTQVFASPVIEERPAAVSQGAPEVGFTTQAGGRDAIVVAVCVLLSAAMLIWLFFLS